MPSPRVGCLQGRMRTKTRNICTHITKSWDRCCIGGGAVLQEGAGQAGEAAQGAAKDASDKLQSTAKDVSEQAVPTAKQVRAHGLTAVKCFWASAVAGLGGGLIWRCKRCTAPLFA